ncbi:MAG: ABC transporter ATP-binding protein [Actinomycetota bacterium]
MIRFLRRLWPVLPAPQRRRARLIAAGAVLLALLDACGVALVFPLVQLGIARPGDELSGPARWLSEWLGTQDTGRLALILASSVVVVFVGKGILAVVLLRSNIRVALESETAVADRLVRGYLAAPLTFHLGRNSAELQRTLHESLRRVFQEGLATAIPAIGDRVVLIAVGVVLAVVAPIEALAGGIWFAVLIWAYRRLTSQRVSASSAALVQESRHAIQRVQQALASVREVKISGRADAIGDAILRNRELAASRMRLIALTDQLPRYYLEIGLIGGAAVVSAVAFQLRTTTTALAVVGLFVAAGLRLLPSLNRSLNAEGKARVAIPNLEVIEADLAATPNPEEVDRPDRDPLDGDEPFRQLVLGEVDFSYPGREPVLAGVDLTVEAGETIGVVGGSGAGKSTLIGLVLGLLDPSGGEVTVNGRALADCRLSWQQRLGYVPQSVAVLDASVRENVAFGCPPQDIDDDRVRAALAAAQLDEFVAGLPGGLLGELGEDGARMSGGQRQRLGLARALYDRPSLLVLDEATSSLDAATERRILRTLEALRGDVTMVIVSHRHSAIRSADRVVHLAGGRVHGIGRYEELLATDPLFSELASMENDDDGGGH